MILRTIMKPSFQTMIDRKRQQGAALIIGLMLLVVITVLAVSGMNTATTELAMARNDQTYENAFQAAETGLENALAQGNFSTVAPVVITPTTGTYEVVSATINYEGSTLVPDRAFSLGAGSGIAAYHFQVTSQAAFRVTGSDTDITDRDATAVHTQAFYVVGPGASTF
jgi:type IV pilus assembly protein PilX